MDSDDSATACRLLLAPAVQPLPQPQHPHQVPTAIALQSQTKKKKNRRSKQSRWHKFLHHLRVSVVGSLNKGKVPEDSA